MWFVSRPMDYFVVAALFAAVALARTRMDRWTVSPTAFALPIASWMLGGLWELLVMRWSPDADLRLDLVLILPVLIVISAWSILRMLFDSIRA